MLRPISLIKVLPVICFSGVVRIKWSFVSIKPLSETNVIRSVDRTLSAAFTEIFPFRKILPSKDLMVEIARRRYLFEKKWVLSLLKRFH